MYWGKTKLILRRIGKMMQKIHVEEHNNNKNIVKFQYKFYEFQSLCFRRSSDRCHDNTSLQALVNLWLVLNGSMQ